MLFFAVTIPVGKALIPHYCLGVPNRTSVHKLILFFPIGKSCLSLLPLCVLDAMKETMTTATKSPTWKTFPIMDDEDNSKVAPLPYSETEDILLPEDYRPTKCENSSNSVLYTGIPVWLISTPCCLHLFCCSIFLSSKDDVINGRGKKS